MTPKRRGPARVIQVDELTVRFGGVIPMNRMTLSFPGGTCGLIGPNGAGKTTFFNVLSGFVRPVEEGHGVRRRHLGRGTRSAARGGGSPCTFQTEQAVAEMTGSRTCSLVLEHSGAIGSTRRTEVIDAVDFVGLEPGSNRPVGTSERSSGVVEVARAVVGKPRSCCSTSPRPALPTRRRPPSATSSSSIPDRTGALMILVDHDIELVFACATYRRARLRPLIASGPTAEVLSNPTRDGGPISDRRRGGRGVSDMQRTATSSLRIEGSCVPPRAAGRCCTACRSTSRRARSRHCSGPTAPASPRWCLRLSAGAQGRRPGRVYSADIEDLTGGVRKHPPRRRRGRRAGGPAPAARASR